MVGEIRDAETAQIALQSALTGHLVFTTVHANNAFDVIGRFAHMGVDVYGFVSSLNCVMAQRLVRLVCARCRRPAGVDLELLEASGLDPERYAGHEWTEGAGCEHCNGTGYRRGRVRIAEEKLDAPMFSGAPTPQAAEALAKALRKAAGFLAKKSLPIHVSLPDALLRWTVLELDQLPDKRAAQLELVAFRFAR